ncbi:MAG: hypothetical protein KDB10_13570 [Acidimicrobiales bacterium]|nr:hypothetical protein [Acidimicrobiales bacterium]
MALAAGDRVLVKEQTDPNENGIYDHGNGRSRDSNQIGDGALGQVLFVAEGSVNRGQAFVVADLSPPTFEPVVHWRTLSTSTSDRSPEQADGEFYALYTHTLPAGQLCRAGDRIEAMWAGTYGSSASSRQLRVTLAGDTVFDSSALSISEGNWRLSATVIRVDETTARTSVQFGVTTAVVNGTSPQYDEVTTGLDFSTAEDLVLKGSVSSSGSSAPGDLTGRIATVTWAAAAPG